MPRLFSNRDRPFDLGALPAERLARDARAPIVDARQLLYSMREELEK